MSAQNVTESQNYESIYSRISELESRIAGLEEALHFKQVTGGFKAQQGTAPVRDDSEFIQVDKLVLESKIGEFGFTWLGSLVLLFAIAFLMTFITKQGSPMLATIIGYACVAGVFLTTYLIRKSLEHLGFMLKISGYLLLYYITFRLFYFSAQPILTNKFFEVALLLIVSAFQLIFAFRNKSELMTSLALILVLVTSIFSDSLHYSLAMVTLTSAVGLYGFWKNNWTRTLLLNIWLVYLFHLNWLFGNPLAGHDFAALSTHPYSLIYLFITGGIYSVTALLANNERFPLSTINSIVVCNAIAFSMVAFIAATVLFPNNYVGMFGLITLFCISYSVVLEIIRRNPFIPSLFACFGFMALSVCVYGFAGLPNVYFYLALQSFMVVCIALWFGSRIITMMNTLLFAVILLMYMFTAHPVNLISFTFALVAFGSARIINWKKERLTLKTDLVRNVYLFSLFFVMLYACYYTFPARYAAISWASVAVLYFILSLILHNTKYRWMSVATLIVTVLYVFMVDLAQLEVGYRVVAFLILSVVLFAGSLYYTKSFRKKKAQSSEE